MALRKIVVEGDEVLRKRCKEVPKVNDHIREILLDMLDTMRDSYGVGIAAPQVGILRRMFVALPNPFYPELGDTEEDREEERIYFMINPEIIEMSDNLLEGNEGCLSVPEKVGTVLRPDYIKMKALDFNGEEKVYEFYDFDARVMLHEYDHLDGILYIDKAINIQNTNEIESEDN